MHERELTKLRGIRKLITQPVVIRSMRLKSSQEKAFFLQASVVSYVMDRLTDNAHAAQTLQDAKNACRKGNLDDAAILDFLSKAMDWHTRGWIAEQKCLCELLLSVRPTQPDALHLLGHALQAEGAYAEAEDCYRKALAARPGFAYAELALSQMRMLRSEFVEGRKQYESRFEAVTEGSGADWRGLPIARWNGESLAGKKLYLWAEQGLGDVIMFAGFLRWVAAQKPRHVVIGMYPKLVTLFARSFAGMVTESLDDIVHVALAPAALDAMPKLEALGQHVAASFPIEPLKAAYAYAKRHGLFDYAAPMGDLLVYGMPSFRPGSHEPYLLPDPQRVRHIRAGLDGDLRKSVGISWFTSNMRESYRNIPLEQWVTLLKHPGYQFVSLQHHGGEAEIARFNAQHGTDIKTVPQIPLTEDAEGLVALTAAMDKVITIDNSNAHIAGALGVPTVLLLPKGANYRWPVQQGGDALWYGSVHAIRQSSSADWTDLMAKAVNRLD